MISLHTCHRWARGAAAVLALALGVALVTPVAAVPFAGPGYVADCSLDIHRSADPSAYYLEIGFDGAVAPDIALQVRGRLLRIQVRQGGDQWWGGCRTRFSKTLTLPRDADAPRIERRDETGRVLFVIPRREPYWQ